MQAFQLIAEDESFNGSFRSWAAAQGVQLSLLEYWAPGRVPASKGSLPTTEASVDSVMDNELIDRSGFGLLGFMESYT